MAKKQEIKKDESLEKRYQRIMESAKIKPKKQSGYFTMPTVLRDVPSFGAGNSGDNQ